MTNINSKYDSFIHFTVKFNSRDYSISFFSGIFNNFFSRKIQFKNWFKNLNFALFNSTKYSFNQKTRVSDTTTSYAKAFSIPNTTFSLCWRHSKSTKHKDTEVSSIQYSLGTYLDRHTPSHQPDRSIWMAVITSEQFSTSSVITMSNPQLHHQPQPTPGQTWAISVATTPWCSGSGFPYHCCRDLLAR